MRIRQYKYMWQICILIFGLSHAQSQVERGFNINKNTLRDNLQKKFLVRRRILYDTLIDSGRSTHDFVITDELILRCKSAFSKYNNELTKKKENTTNTKNNKKKKAVFEQNTEFKRQKISLENCNEKMETINI